MAVVDARFTSDVHGASAKNDSVPPQSNQGPDRYAVRLLKYVPAEIIVLYTGLSNVISAASKGSFWLCIPFTVGLVATYWYLWRMQSREIQKGVKRDGLCWTDIHISAAAFVVWAFSLGGPFTLIPSYPGWGPLTSGLLLPTFTFLAPLIKP